MLVELDGRMRRKRRTAVPSIETERLKVTRSYRAKPHLLSPSNSKRINLMRRSHRDEPSMLMEDRRLFQSIVAVTSRGKGANVK